MTFWSFIIAGLINMTSGLVTNNFAVHQSIGMVQKTSDIAASAIGMAFVVGFSVFDMTIPIIAFGVIMAAETVRWIYSTWRWFKGLVV
jgi:hypothetical protein